MRYVTKDSIVLRLANHVQMAHALLAITAVADQKPPTKPSLHRDSLPQRVPLIHNLVSRGSTIHTRNEVSVPRASLAITAQRIR